MTLHNNAILQQPDRFVLDPHLPGEDLLDERLRLVLLHPNLVPIAVRGAKRIKRDTLFGSMRHAVHIIRRQGSFIIGHTRHRSAVAKLFPRAERSVVGGVYNDAQTLVSRHGNVEADKEEREHKEPPPTRFVRHDE